MIRKPESSRAGRSEANAAVEYVVEQRLRVGSAFNEDSRFRSIVDLPEYVSLTDNDTLRTKSDVIIIIISFEIKYSNDSIKHSS